MRGISKWAVYLAVAAVALTLMITWPHNRGRLGTGASPTGNSLVGTSGHENAPEPEDSPAVVHDLDTLLRTVDQNELIGRRVDFHVKVAEVSNYTSFWVGNKDNRMLVVLGQDHRSEAGRDRGTPSPNGAQAVKVGQLARITGMIEALPSADARHSWKIDDSLRRELNDQQVYIRAANLVPEG